MLCDFKAFVVFFNHTVQCRTEKKILIVKGQVDALSLKV